jgi:hypothetical protein
MFLQEEERKGDMKREGDALHVVEIRAPNT